MVALKILASDSNPSINFDPKKERFEIRGNSMPENTSAFYEPLISWLDKYAEKPNPKTEFTFRMNILNTSSTKLFIDIFKMINKIVDSGYSEVNVVWFYNYGDDDIQEVGLDFKEFSKAPFELVAIHD